jgi:hypothetical protein
MAASSSNLVCVQIKLKNEVRQPAACLYGLFDKV